MLNDAVRRLKGDTTVEEEFETAIDLQVDAYIPATYISSEFQKLDMYKRIAGIEKVEEYRDLQEELTDRFGDIPVPAENLLRVALLRADAHRARMTQVVQKADGIRFYLHEGVMIDGERAAQMLERYQGRMKYVQEEQPYFCYIMKEVKKTQRSNVTNYRAASKVTKPSKAERTEEIFFIVSSAIKEIGGLYEEK